MMDRKHKKGCANNARKVRANYAKAARTRKGSGASACNPMRTWFIAYGSAEIRPIA
jgi:hypothetical protein